jgi:hypothetical protein
MSFPFSFRFKADKKEFLRIYKKVAEAYPQAPELGRGTDEKNERRKEEHKEEKASIPKKCGEPFQLR